MPAWLLAALPGPSVLYRIGAYAALVLAIFGFGWFKGSQHWHGVLIEEQAKALTEGVRIARGRDIVTTKVQTVYVPQIARAQVITETIVKEVPVYVSADAPDLPAGWRVLHDAAATGGVPDAARIPDAAPVGAQDAASTVAENYGLCRADQLKLAGLQEWIHRQQQVR